MMRFYEIQKLRQWMKAIQVWEKHATNSVLLRHVKEFSEFPQNSKHENTQIT